MTPEPVMADPLAWLCILAGVSAFTGTLFGYAIGRMHERRHHLATDGMEEDQMTEGTMQEHPAFTKAKSLPEPLRSYFPKSHEEAREFVQHVETRALSSRVLVVAQTRIECAWCAYCDAAPGRYPDQERQKVLDFGDKLSEDFARALFPQFKDVPYAR